MTALSLASFAPDEEGLGPVALSVLTTVRVLTREDLADVMEDPEVWKPIVARCAKKVIDEEERLIVHVAPASAGSDEREAGPNEEEDFVKSMTAPLLEVKFKRLLSKVAQIDVKTDKDDSRKGRDTYVSRALKQLDCVPIDLVIPANHVLDALARDAFAFIDFKVLKEDAGSRAGEQHLATGEGGAAVFVKAAPKGKEVVSFEEWVGECLAWGAAVAVTLRANTFVVVEYVGRVADIAKKVGVPQALAYDRRYRSNMGVKVRRLMETQKMTADKAFECYMRENWDTELLAQTYARLHPVKLADGAPQRQKGGGSRSSTRPTGGSPFTPGVCRFTAAECPFKPRCKYRVHADDTAAGLGGKGKGVGKGFWSSTHEAAGGKFGKGQASAGAESAKRPRSE